MNYGVQITKNTGRWVLFATIAASSMAFISSSSLNIALPAIQREMGASGADVLWILNAFSLLLAALILVGGSLGDHYGRKRIFTIGIIVFGLASLACGLASSTSFLIFSRAIQGIGGALMIPGSLAIISAYFDDDERGKAIGTWSAVTTLAVLLGPVIGGWLAENGFWRGVFFINIPFAIVTLIPLYFFVPESHDEQAQRQLDFLGAGLVTLGLAGFTFGFVELGRVGVQEGLGDPLIIGSIIGGIIGLVAFVLVEWRSKHPMMPLRLFRSRTFSGANLLTFLLYGALYVVSLFLSLNFIQVQGYSETQAGLAMIPFSIILALLSRWAGGLVDRYGPRIPLIIGPAITGIGFLIFGLIGITNGFEDYWTSYFIGVLVWGLGMGITVAPLTTAVMGSVSQHNAGIASGINNAMSRSAQVLGTAILGGVALIIFSSTLLSDVETLSLPDAALTALEEQAVDLGNTQVPEGLNDTQSEAVQTAIDQNFVYTFQIIMFICAALAWLSAFIAFLMVDSRLQRLPD